ncbi:MAG: hypothetical protein ABSF44_04645 [Candidatus Bathyarchaeia archaeon]
MHYWEKAVAQKIYGGPNPRLSDKTALECSVINQADSNCVVNGAFH